MMDFLLSGFDQGGRLVLAHTKEVRHRIVLIIYLYIHHTKC